MEPLTIGARWGTPPATTNGHAGNGRRADDQGGSAGRGAVDDELARELALTLVDLLSEYQDPGVPLGGSSTSGSGGATARGDGHPPAGPAFLPPLRAPRPLLTWRGLSTASRWSSSAGAEQREPSPGAPLSLGTRNHRFGGTRNPPPEASRLGRWTPPGRGGCPMNVGGERRGRGRTRLG